MSTGRKLSGLAKAVLFPLLALSMIPVSASARELTLYLNGRAIHFNGDKDANGKNNLKGFGCSIDSNLDLFLIDGINTHNKPIVWGGLTYKKCVENKYARICAGGTVSAVNGGYDDINNGGPFPMLSSYSEVKIWHFMFNFYCMPFEGGVCVRKGGINYDFGGAQ